MKSQQRGTPLVVITTVGGVFVSFFLFIRIVFLIIRAVQLKLFAFIFKISRRGRPF